MMDTELKNFISRMMEAETDQAKFQLDRAIDNDLAESQIEAATKEYVKKRRMRCAWQKFLEEMD